MKYKMIMASLALLFVLAVAPAYGEDEVYYCSEIKSNGFNYDKERGSYIPTKFIVERFKMKLDRASNHMEIAPENQSKMQYTCKIPYSFNEDEMGCTSFMYHFNFNTGNGRFVYFKGVGYVGDKEGINPDSLTVSYGKCDKF